MRRDIVVLGGSAGAVEALKEVASGLRPTIDAAFFVVCPTDPMTPGTLHRVLGKSTSLPVDIAQDGAPIVPRRVYVAPPDRHLLLEPERMRVLAGPKHNRTRPAIDPLFRSAAEGHGVRVIGVLLSGTLDDGVAGLLAIKRQQGVTVIQDPADALFPDLPRNALTTVAVHHCVKLAEIAPLVTRLCNEQVVRERVSFPRALHAEAEVDAGDFEHLDQIGKPSGYSCPECGGVLWEVDDPELARFRCRVGHSFSMEGLHRDKSENTEDALWAALCALREDASLSRKLVATYRARNINFAVDELERKIARHDRHAEEIERILTKTRREDPMTK
jgi:two-component system chemotaxis response regulator CheB